ncbi:MAG: M50 family metallopeptidase [Solirubrobacterales bacterium]
MSFDWIPWSWLLVFAGFSALIILHEFGHFIVAKWTGMRVERFFLFFPPKLVSVKRGETEYGIGAIPLGGFVKITGMNPEELEPRTAPKEAPAGRGELATDADAGRDTPQGLLERVESAGQDPSDTELPQEVRKRAYYNQPVWKRIAVIAAGPAMNVLVAFVILFVLAFGAERATSLEVAEVEPGSPAAQVLREGDELIAVDGVRATNGGSEPSSGELGDRAERLSDQINAHTCAGTPRDGCRATTPATVVIERDGGERTVRAPPVYDADRERYRLGFAFQAGDLVPVNPSVPEAAQRSADFMWQVTTTTLGVVVRIFQPEQREQISGVVGISYVGEKVIGFGATEALTLLALISLSLAIINLFPFLPLDGGHIFWSLVEKIRGKRVPFSVIERASAVGFMLVLFLFFIGLSNDIGRLTGEGFDIE